MGSGGLPVDFTAPVKLFLHAPCDSLTDNVLANLSANTLANTLDTQILPSNLSQMDSIIFDEDYWRHEEEEEDALAAFVGSAILGRPTPIRTLRTYLTRDDLAGHPRSSSAWAHLRAVGNDRAYVTTMGVDVQTFEALLEHFNAAWDLEAIYRADVNPNGAPQLARRSLDAAGGLGLVLHWLSSTMASHTLQQIFAITPAVCARYLQHGRRLLLDVLRDLEMAKIVWPSREEKTKYYSSLIERKFPLLTKCFGFIDGLNLPVMVADDDE
ncbi:hypothetical protein PGTUg99_020147 [Puccinia graminis f. sp. tritici]|uniref:Uncharacterized protein n=1 Tax=Puccinia graminis f. sp. tritici TaxID=56615 RepID=A0A5B0RNX4_PUCGR|nr:hypothetical protein PGTUg99_020147 [Puccinia graminis f. sp. tritici]